MSTRNRRSMSPAAWAVMDAAEPCVLPYECSGLEAAIAAAFFAAVDQVDWSWEPCEQLLAIANELEGQS